MMFANASRAAIEPAQRAAAAEIAGRAAAAADRWQAPRWTSPARIRKAERAAALDAAIVDRVARFFGRRAEHLLSRRRDQHTAWARHVATYLCRTIGAESFPAIGRRFGRDHSTVIHSCRLVELRMAAEPRFCASVASLARDITRQSAAQEAAA